MNTVDEALSIAQLRHDLRTGRFREIRKRAGLSQPDVARAVGTDPPMVSRWETGKSQPGRAYALKLADLLWKLDRVSREAP
jgi:transcriptional regulator with XRE-family HTH domain